MGDYAEIAAYVHAVAGESAVQALQRKLQSPEYQNDPAKVRRELERFFDETWKKGVRRGSSASRERHPTAKLQDSRKRNFQAFLEQTVLSDAGGVDKAYYSPRGQRAVDWRGLRQAYLDAKTGRGRTLKEAGAFGGLLDVLSLRKTSAESPAVFRRRLSTQAQDAVEEKRWDDVDKLQTRLQAVLTSGRDHPNLKYDDAVQLAAEIEADKASARPTPIRPIDKAWSSKEKLASYLDKATGTVSPGRRQEPLGLLRTQVKAVDAQLKPTKTYVLARSLDPDAASTISVSADERRATERALLRQNPVLSALSPRVVEARTNQRLLADATGLPTFERAAEARLTRYTYSFTPRGGLLTRPSRHARTDADLHDLVAAASFTHADYDKVFTPTRSASMRGDTKLPYQEFSVWQTSIRQDVTTAAEILAKRASADDDLALLASGASYALTQARQSYQERRNP